MELSRSEIDPSQNLSSLYYLHYGENTGLVFVLSPLNENNYHIWSRNMKRAFLSKSKLKFIDGSILKLMNHT